MLCHMDMVQQIKEISELIIDSYFIVDADRTILDFNSSFYTMLPRNVGRGLKGKKCYDVLNLDICQGKCIAEQCWKLHSHVRLDEIRGKVAKTDRKLAFILSALPFFDDAGQPAGAIVIQRNVTDEAQVQLKYQEMLESEKREHDRLKNIIRSRTKDLLETGQELMSVKRELMAFKKGRII